MSSFWGPPPSVRKKAQDVYGEWKNLRSKTEKSKQYVRSIATEAEEFYERLYRYENSDENTIVASYRAARMAFFRRLKGKLDRDYKKLKSGFSDVKAAGEEAHQLSYKVFLSPFETVMGTITLVPELDRKWGRRADALKAEIGSWQMSALNLEGQDLVDACEKAMRMAKQARNEFNAFVEE